MMTTHNYQHGQIRCGTVLVNDIQRSTALYCDALQQEVVEQSQVTHMLSTAWSAPRLAGAKTSLLSPTRARDGDLGTYIRLVQSPDLIVPSPHATTIGWCAFEISVMDVFELEQQLKSSEFTVVGPPKRLDGIANVIPMQVVGPDQEVFYLNQVLESSNHNDLPRAQYPIDRLFIVVLATADRAAVVQEYCERFALQEGQSIELRYGLINRAFGLDVDTKHHLTLVQQGRIPIVEVDQYPTMAQPREVIAGSLPLGNAMVSIAVSRLDDLPLINKLSPKPAVHDGLLYEGSRSIVVRGSSNELIELIEVQ